MDVYRRLNVGLGSGSVLWRHHQEGLFLGVERTKSGEKRTSRLEGSLRRGFSLDRIELNVGYGLGFKSSWYM